jgi:hypothetical protein
MLKPDRQGNMKAVMGGAGANNSRIMTALLLKVAGIEKPVDETTDSPEMKDAAA